jgi:hypothetical protein
MSFRPEGEILLGSLVITRDDGRQPVTLASFAFFARDTRLSGNLFVRSLRLLRPTIRTPYFVTYVPFVANSSICSART